MKSASVSGMLQLKRNNVVEPVDIFTFFFLKKKKGLFNVLLCLLVRMFYVFKAFSFNCEMRSCLQPSVSLCDSLLFVNT